MNPALFGALFFTVILLVTTAYFLMGGIPLLVLRHDTPLDAGFVRGFFNVYYKAAVVAALGACISYALWGRLAFAAGAGAIAVMALFLRSRLIPAMQQLGARIGEDGSAAIRQFRRIHLLALGVNLLQLVVLVWSTTRLSL
jgi:hypothetical protein